MAKHQTRKSVSFNRAVFDATQCMAKKLGKSMAHFIEDALRAAGVDLPPTTHVPLVTARRAVKNRPVKVKAPAQKSLPRAQPPKPKPKLEPSVASQRSAYYASIRAEERAAKRKTAQSESAKPPPPYVATRVEAHAAKPEAVPRDLAKPPPPLKEEQPSTRREGPIRKALGDAVADWAREP
jgi:hypothetical protein